MILVAGSTGILGSEICRRLTSRGRVVRGLVRETSNADRVAALKLMGAETVVGDLRNPDSLGKACQGVDTVISTVTTTISMQPGDSIPVTDQQGNLSLVQAAKEAGVRHFIFISYPASIESGMPDPSPLTVAKRTVEKAVIDSGMDYTILQPGVYMEVWLSPAIGFDFPHSKANIMGDGHAKVNYISVGDVAEYAVQSVDNPAARNQVFEIGGPKALSPLEAVRTFERLCGNPFELQFVPAAALQAQREAASDPLQKSFASLFLSCAAGVDLDDRPARQVFSFPLTSVEDYARRALA